MYKKRPLESRALTDAQLYGCGTSAYLAQKLEYLMANIGE